MTSSHSHEPTTLLDEAETTQRAQLLRVAIWLSWATVIWNVVEAIVAIGAGAADGSSALIGFGLDSTIETASAAIIIWQFSAADVTPERELRALRLIAASFFALAIYVSGQAIVDLISAHRPDGSPIGIVIASLSLIVMPILGTTKRRIGRQLESASITADSQQTWLCTYLSAVLLAGLVLNAGLGWWWADPIAALLIAALATREGVAAWRGDTCCD